MKFALFFILVLLLFHPSDARADNLIRILSSLSPGRGAKAAEDIGPRYVPIDSTKKGGGYYMDCLRYYMMDEIEANDLISKNIRNFVPPIRDIMTYDGTGLGKTYKFTRYSPAIDWHGIGQNPKSQPAETYVKKSSIQTKTKTVFRKEYEKYAPDGRFVSEVQEALSFVFRQYAERGSATDGEIRAFTELESQLSLKRSTYLVYSKPVTNEIKAVGRIYDGSPSVWIDQGESLSPERMLLGSGERLPIERQFPHVTLPERKYHGAKAKVLEIGRLAKAKDLRDTLDPFLGRIAEYLYDAHVQVGGKMDDVTIYVEASKAAVELYRPYGFKIVFGPDTLSLPTKKTDSYCLSVHSREFYLKYRDMRRFPSRNPNGGKASSPEVSPSDQKPTAADRLYLILDATKGVSKSLSPEVEGTFLEKSPARLKKTNE